MKAAFEAYLRLTDDQREQLVSNIRILDGSPDINDVSQKIQQRLQVRKQHREPMFTRLEGWWLNRVIRHFRQLGDKITKAELLDQIVFLSDQFRPEALPLDFFDAEPPEQVNLTTDQRMFVRQLRSIVLSSELIEMALKDYYRAFEQRSRWAREQLLFTNELDQYERRLIEAWQRKMAHLKQDAQVDTEEDQQRLGRELLRQLEENYIPIRPAVDAPYVMLGSYHMLANEDQPRVWWHPEFINRLQQIIKIPKTIEKATELLPTQKVRPIEVANHFNPAFCARLLRGSIRNYQNEAGSGMPYPLLFLILPLTLPKSTRTMLPRGVSTKMHSWLQDHPEARIDFAPKARYCNYTGVEGKTQGGK